MSIEKNTIYNCDCLAFMRTKEFAEFVGLNKVCIVTDPPFNIGKKYNTYDDNMEEDAYYGFLEEVFMMYNLPFVVIHYPEILYKISFEVGVFPEKVVSWVYNSNTARQHRDIAFFNILPDFTKVKQPYKNPKDKRIAKRIAEGKGARLYDWWNINQVKNVSKKEINHPCVMPLEVMKRIIGILLSEYVFFDPFMGVGTTGMACQQLGRKFIGCEIDADYYELCKKRLKLEV